MKTKAILMCYLAALGACMLAAAPQAAMAAATHEQRVGATRQQCAAGTYAGSVPRIYQDLNTIYASDDDFKRDAGEGGRSLHDGKLGSNTRKWLGVFCERHAFKVRAGSFDADVAAELDRFASDAGSAPAPASKAPVEPAPPIEATYRYDPTVLRKPKDVELVLRRLRRLTDRYDHKQLFDDAVRRALKGLVLNKTTLQHIEDVAAVDGYQLQEKKLGELKGISPALLEKLKPRTGIDYASADEFHMDLQSAVGEGPERAELNRNFAPIDELARVTSYQIPTTVATERSDAAALEPPVAALYKSMAYVEYPSKELFELAMRARVERAFGMCDEDRYPKDRHLEGEDFNALWALVDGKNEMTGQVTRLRAMKTRCSKDQLDQAQRIIGKAHTVLFAKLQYAAQLVKMNTPPAGQSGPDAVSGCGCAHDGRESMTYGFYPLWTNGAETDGTRKKLDFDILSRIGLYGLTIDEKGRLKYPTGVNVPPWTLLEAAHRHMTKVDWVLYKSDWGTGEGAGMTDLFNNLEQSIGALLATPPPHRDWWGTALLTFGREQGPLAGDGITLRFERFPSGRAAQETLNGFVERLYKRLQAMEPARQLNIMVTQAEMVDPKNPTFSPANLLALMQRTNHIDDQESPASSKRLRENDVQVLVMLQEPTSVQKLELRAAAESTLNNVGRVRLLRNLVPVLEYDGVRAEQLKDDIIYFQDNFGGIGFWPLSFAPDKDDVSGSTTANHVLHDYFNDAGIDGGFLGKVIDLICPNRRWLRWLAWISTIVAAWVVVKRVRCHGCGTRLDSKTVSKAAVLKAGMWVLVMLPVVVIAALAVGDPAFRSDSVLHWVVAAILIGGLILLPLYRLFRPTRKLP